MTSIGPDCHDKKHPACDVRALDHDDQIVRCQCWCHNILRKDEG